MASLLLFLRAIVSANDERLTGAAAAEEEEEETAPPRDTEDEERWLVSCLEWARVDRKSAWMQIV
jgi:hypothetical protein